MSKITTDDLRTFLSARGIRFTERPVQYGNRFDCAGGEVLICYDSGKLVKQGKRTALTADIEQWEQSGATSSAAVKTVFIVYGHDLDARNDLELLIRRMGLEPVILDSLPCAGDTLIEKLEQYLTEQGKVAYACVLLTPDDEGHRIGHPNEKMARARQNVVLELGMVLSQLGRQRVAILLKAGVEKPSDIGGLIYIEFAHKIAEIKAKLFQELTSAGFNPSSAALA
jgi:predicted nucleotide-binding protein